MTKKGVYPYDYLDSFEKFTKKNMHFRTTCTSDRTSVIVGRPLRKLQEGMHGELQAGFMPLLHASGAVLECYVKMTKMELELMSDINMFQFIEKGMRGGISSIMHRYGKANKLKQGYVEELVTKYIMYIDANNLYGWAMIQYLPTGGFKWLTEDETRSLSKYHEDSEERLMLEVGT